MGTDLVTNFWSYSFHLKQVLSDLQLSFNLSRKGQKAILEADLAFDSRFQNYLAKKVFYKVLEFWLYLSWF